LTNTFCICILSATISRQAVTVDGNPWGMFATIMTEKRVIAEGNIIRSKKYITSDFGY